MTSTNPHNIAILFDFDGVLVDSEGEYSVFWRDMASRYGLPTSFSDDIKGTTIGEILMSFPQSDHQAILDALHRYEREMKYPIFPGVMDFLITLRHEGIPSAIVTSGDNNKMEMLRGRVPELLGLVDTIITGDMVTHSKPHPEPYLRGAEKLGMPIDRCFVFEDSLQGLQSGRASGAKVIGIATTNPRSAVEPLADLTVDHFSEITLPALLAL